MDARRVHGVVSVQRVIFNSVHSIRVTVTSRVSLVLTSTVDERVLLVRQVLNCTAPLFIQPRVYIGGLGRDPLPLGGKNVLIFNVKNMLNFERLKMYTGNVPALPFQISKYANAFSHYSIVDYYYHPRGGIAIT